MDQAAERYLKKLRRALVCSKKDKERLIDDAKDLLENFAQENPGAFYQDYVASFGQPEDFAGEMLTSLDPEDVHEAGQRRKRALIAVTVAVAAVLVLLAGIWLGQRSQPGAEVPTPTPDQTVAPTAEVSSEPTAEPTPTPASGPVTFVEGQFTDYADITHKEAVGTLVALKIINGKEDGGYFDPSGYVTRGEAAKMIAVLMNGGSEANTGAKKEPTFTDIQGHWAESWIEYCADMHIVFPQEAKEGEDPNQFDPNGLVTGVEMLRMCLTSLGYDAEAFHLVGENWKSQTMERAHTTSGRKLTEGLEKEVVFVEPVTRDAVAQILYNALQATTMTIRPSQNGTTGEVIWEYSNEGNTTLLEQRYGKKLDEIVYE